MNSVNKPPSHKRKYAVMAEDKTNEMSKFTDPYTERTHNFIRWIISLVAERRVVYDPSDTVA
jgi:hypothetical protein